MTLANRERKYAFTALRWSLGVVVLIQAAMFLFSSAARHEFANTHLPSALRLFLGIGEILGSVLMLVPRAAAMGARLLMLIFAVAIVIHLLHGATNVGALVIYFAAVWSIAATRGVA